MILTKSMGSDNKPSPLKTNVPSTPPLNRMETPSGGIAPKWAPEEPDSFIKPFTTFLGVCSMMQAIGCAMAYAVYTLGATSAYSAKLGVAVANEQHWAAAAIAVVGFVIRFVNMWPMVFKEKVMKGALRDEIGANMRSNPFIYKSVGVSKETVLFENDGVIGKYNRANRSLTHMIENFGSMLAGMSLAGTVFPFPTFICACAFGVGRVVHQTGYAGGYGKHGAGFGISTLGQLCLEGLLILIVLAGCGLITVTPPPSACLAEDRIATLEASVKAMAT